MNHGILGWCGWVWIRNSQDLQTRSTGWLWVYQLFKILGKNNVNGFIIVYNIFFGCIFGIIMDYPNLMGLHGIIQILGPLDVCCKAVGCWITGSPRNSTTEVKVEQLQLWKDMIQIWLNYGSPYSHNLAMDQVLDFHVQSSLNGFFIWTRHFQLQKKCSMPVWLHFQIFQLLNLCTFCTVQCRKWKTGIGGFYSHFSRTCSDPRARLGATVPEINIGKQKKSNIVGFPWIINNPPV